MTGDKIVHDEANKSIGMRILLVLEIEAIMHLLDTCDSLVSVVLQNQLLQVQESTLVMDALSQLHL